MQRHWGILTVIVLVALTGCVGKEPDISLDPDNAVRCVDAAETGEAYAAFGLTNFGDTTKVASVDFGSLQSLEVLDTWIMPLVDGTGLDISTGPIDIPNWGTWTDAVGSTLPGDATVDLVVHLRTSNADTDAYLRGVTVTTENGAEESAADTMVGIIASKNCVLSDGTVPVPPAASGSVMIGGGLTDICADGSDGGGRTYGLPINNSSSAPVTLTDATVEHIAGAELIGMWIVGPEVEGGDIASWSDSYPADRQPGWADRTDVAGTTLSAGATTWLALAMTLPEGVTTGNVSGITLEYDGAAGSETPPTAPHSGSATATATRSSATSSYVRAARSFSATSIASPSAARDLAVGRAISR